MEVASFPQDLFLELVVVHVDSGLDEHDGGWSTAANYDTLCNETWAHCACVVFNGLGIASKTGL